MGERDNKRERVRAKESEKECDRDLFKMEQLLLFALNRRAVRHHSFIKKRMVSGTHSSHTFPSCHTSPVLRVCVSTTQDTLNETPEGETCRTRGGGRVTARSGRTSGDAVRGKPCSLSLSESHN